MLMLGSSAECISGDWIPHIRKNLHVQSVPIQITPSLSKRIKITNQYTSQPKALMFVPLTRVTILTFPLTCMSRLQKNMPLWLRHACSNTANSSEIMEPLRCRLGKDCGGRWIWQSKPWLIGWLLSGDSTKFCFSTMVATVQKSKPIKLDMVVL